MEIVLFWIGLSIVVGVAANTRHRNAFGWFFLALVISPLIAGLLVLALPARPKEPLARIPPWDRVARAKAEQKLADEKAVREERSVFQPDGVYAGVPYKVLGGGAVEAFMSGNRIRFRDLDMFKASVDGGSA